MQIKKIHIIEYYIYFEYRVGQYRVGQDSSRYIISYHHIIIS